MIRMSKCTLKKDKIITWKVDKNDWANLYDLLYDDQEWAGDIKFGYTTCSKRGVVKQVQLKNLTVVVKILLKLLIHL